MSSYGNNLRIAVAHLVSELINFLLGVKIEHFTFDAILLVGIGQKFDDTKHFYTKTLALTHQTHIFTSGNVVTGT